MAEGISLREFGRTVGVTAEAVRKAIADGRIPKSCMGERSIGKNGRTWPVILDPARAAKHWGRNRDEAQVRDKAVMSAGAKAGWAKRRGEEPEDEEPEDEISLPGLGGAPRNKAAAGPSYNDFRRITESYKARMAKLEYEQAVGRLVDAELVAAEQVTLLTSLRNRLRGVPSQAKGRIPHLTIDDIEVLDGLIDLALNETADELDDDEG